MCRPGDDLGYTTRAKRVRLHHRQLIRATFSPDQLATGNLATGMAAPCDCVRRIAASQAIGATV